MSRRRSALAGALGVFLLTAFVVGSIRLAGPPIYDTDGWYHVKYAEVVRHDGLSRSFPWFQESFLKDRFADLNILYHALLIPFTLGDPLRGAQALSVLLAAVTMTIFWGTVRSLRVPWPALWAIGLLALAPEMTYRMTYTRPVVLAIGLALAGTGAILRGQARLAAALTFVYAHWHCSFHLLPCVALLHDVVAPAPGRSRFRTTLWTAGGALAGITLSPYFPNDFRMWWVSNVEVLRASWAMGDTLRIGTELLPLPPMELLLRNFGVFVVFAAALLAIGYRRRVPEEARTLLPVAGGFLVLAFLSQRFIEMAAPFTFLLAAVAVRDVVADHPIGDERQRRAVLVASLFIAAILWRTWAADRAAAADEDPPQYLEASAWIKDHVPPGETIFHLGWDEFPELFYADGTHHYLVGMDPTYMWVTSRERTLLWTQIARGQAEDLYGAIRNTFGCRWVFLPARYVTFSRRIEGDPRFHVVWANLFTSVVHLEDPPAR
ncbi:MAG TPA: hypothetical protein VFV19_06475 [Candidatus Polarisedimenticolaceae bacterium]|nr:hypothetical protein [Candidatus Polarisedimenticolaceae bacterium]